MKKEKEYPYPECKTCESLEDCKHVEIALDGFGSIFPPDSCPKPIDIMKDLYNRKKKRRNGI